MSIDIYKKVVEKWGERSQYEMAQEEFAEASLAVRKHYRKPSINTYRHLAEEIADAIIMIEQIEFMNPGIMSEVEEFKKQKLERLSKRADEDRFE